MSVTSRPARASALRVACTGPIPILRGSTPATADVTTRAMGVHEFLSSASAEAMSTADAPSFKPEEFPAVTVPSDSKAGPSLASFSKLVSGRGGSS